MFLRRPTPNDSSIVFYVYCYLFKYCIVSLQCIKADVNLKLHLAVKTVQEPEVLHHFVKNSAVLLNST